MEREEQQITLETFEKPLGNKLLYIYLKLPIVCIHSSICLHIHTQIYHR